VKQYLDSPIGDLRLSVKGTEAMETRKKFERLISTVLASDAESLERSFVNHLECTLAKGKYTATRHDLYKSLSLTIRDRLVERWIATQQSYYEHDAKRIYYLSLEFLMGRTLGNSLVNMGLMDEAGSAMNELGFNLEELAEMEWDAGLGNGGLGRLAACFLDSMATQELPAYGYGLRYEYGIFFQRIVDGYQVESPDNWLRYENPWEVPRPEYLYNVRFYGRVNQYLDESGILQNEWLDTQNVMAMAYDTPIPGFRNDTVNYMRLWAAKSTREFDLNYFNQGDYIKAVEDKRQSETISKVLYPNDRFFVGQELRLKQEYFFVSATLQDVIRRFKKSHQDLNLFPEKVAIQLNDTHPSVAVPELMRILVDSERVDWDQAWDITVRTFGYTNHTILPEALEKWPVSLFGSVLPRHLQIVYEINQRFLKQVADRYPGDVARLQRMSLIEEGEEKRVRMAHLAVVGSHSTNGVAALHTELLKSKVLKDFFELFPERFNNKTNGITQRRWLLKCNGGLAGLISSRIGDGWVKDLRQLKRLVEWSEDPDFCRAWRVVKLENKQRLARFIQRETGIQVDAASMFDCQVKRLHEYKRQLLNCLHVISLYQRIKGSPGRNFAPRTVIFAGKAAPGYFMAKLILKLINSVAGVVNGDADAAAKLKVCFLANYGVSMAERIMPAADLSEQISTAGTEASGTGNMKFALNGALTIGTLDGANIEIREEVGDDNIFIFGLTASEIAEMKRQGYDPRFYYERCSELKNAIDAVAGGQFSPDNRGLFLPIVESLLQRDEYFLLADFEAYVLRQNDVSLAFRDQEAWTRKSILNVANIGRFSSDRTIQEYAREIWNVRPVPNTMMGPRAED